MVVESFHNCEINILGWLLYANLPVQRWLQMANFGDFLSETISNSFGVHTEMFVI